MILPQWKTKWFFSLFHFSEGRIWRLENWWNCHEKSARNHCCSNVHEMDFKNAVRHSQEKHGFYESTEIWLLYRLGSLFLNFQFLAYWTIFGIEINTKFNLYLNFCLFFLKKILTFQNGCEFIQTTAQIFKNPFE